MRIFRIAMRMKKNICMANTSMNSPKCEQLLRRQFKKGLKIHAFNVEASTSIWRGEEL